MTDHQYSVALTVTYVPYIAMELPSNLLMKRFGANRTLPYMVTLWGVVCACQGAVKSYHGLLACRFFLGALEGGLFPGIVLYMSSFYKRHNLQLRISLMFSSASLAGAFSGLLAAAIQQLHARGIPGWGWIFILEGVFTTLFGIVSAFILPRNPEDTLGLTQGEKEAYRDSLRSDWSGDFEGEVFRWSEVLKAFRSPQVLLICVPLFFNGATLFGLAYFTPSIVSALGYSPNHTQLLTVPPYVCAFFVSIFTSYLSDRYQQRALTAAGLNLLASAGYIIFLRTGHIHADYAALFLQIIGIYATAPTLSAWNANNVQPHYKRATSIAMCFICTNSGGILSTWIFTSPPRYTKTTRLNLAFALCTAFVSVLLAIYLEWRNRKKRAYVERMGGAEKIDNSPEEKLRLGDEHPLFMYTK